MAFEKCRLLETKSLSHNVRSFIFSYPTKWSDTFIPGQFVMLDLPIDHEFTSRSYSIASPPDSEGKIELCIVQKPGGAGTDFLFGKLKPGDEIFISEPNGKFVLTERGYDLCFICTGTGIAPFRSMLKALSRNWSSERIIHLVFGNRIADDILYLSEWREMEQKFPNFRFYPVLSRADDKWQGLRGYVHPVYERIATVNPATDFYICGWTDMVKEAKNNLKSMGLDRKQIKFELYD